MIFAMYPFTLFISHKLVKKKSTADLKKKSSGVMLCSSTSFIKIFTINYLIVALYTIINFIITSYEK